MSAAIVNARDLCAALSRVGMAIERRNTIPVLECARLHSIGGKLVVTGTDMDIEVSSSIDMTGPDIDVMMPSVAQMRRVIGLSGATDVALSMAGGHALRMTAGDVSVTNSTGIPADDFPAMAVLGGALFSATFGRSVLAAMRRVSSAISAEETRYYLNGLFLHSGDLPGEIKIVATDGHRMHIASVAFPDAVGKIPDGGVIIPRKTLSTLLKISDADKKSPIAFRVVPELRRNATGDLATPINMLPRVEFVIGDTAIRSKLIDGTYPDYAKVIPKETPVHITFAVADLVRAVACVTAGVKGDGRPVVGITFSDGAASFECSWNCRESVASVSAPCFHALAAGTGFGVNGRYLLEAIKAIGAESSVTLALPKPPPQNMRAAYDPITLHTPDDASFNAVVMPMRV
jgi:DNA polymerase-3 subunit beta